MTKIEKIREFLSKCPYLKDFADSVDWCDTNPSSYGIIPSGEAVIQRQADILGNVTVIKQYNAVLYAMRYNITDLMRLEASGFLENLIEWIEKEAANGNAPVFGDYPSEEYITAQNGMLFELSGDGKTGRYQIQIQVTYTKELRKDK